MLEYNLGDTRIWPGNGKNLDLLRGPGEINTDRHQVLGARQGTKHTVCRRENRRLPPQVSKRNRKVANDVTNTANLAFRQRAVLCGDQKCSLAVYESDPGLTGEMQILSQHVRRHQRESAVGNPETTRAISVCVIANNGTVLDY